MVGKNITCNMFNVWYFHMIKQKAYLLTESSDQLNNLNIVAPALLF